jgi:2-polyprenyl-3-methyl-5-hydroxy-6-metoxy-1,4-benzoquinol methylase
LVKVLKKHSKGAPVRTILDIACGTGSHAQILAKHGIQVVGSDISADMVSIAKSKARGANPRYINRDMRKLGHIDTFDAVICMFAALNYITNYSDLERILKGVTDNLKPGGLFFCDVWNGLAVMSQRPSPRVKYVDRQGTFLVRSSESVLDPARHLCDVHFRLTVFAKGLARPLTYEETHKTRFYFPEELKYVYSKNGLEVIDVHPFMKPHAKGAGESDWNASIIARKT